MYYLERHCPVCDAGLLGILRCGDGQTLVVMCDECASVWPHPDAVGHAAPHFPAPPAFSLGDGLPAVAGGSCGWADRAEIDHAGFGGWVSDERRYPSRRDVP